jgi:lipoate-protein ligase A
MRVIFSPFQNPFINLSLEDYFLRADVELPVLLFYVNRPCVVLGRFQNPWIECNLPYLVEKDIWLVRRQSGGGCVFHDEGNLNYCFIYPTGMIDRDEGVKYIQAAMKNADIHLDISPRHDLWLEGKKISGSAFKQIKNSSFHHGTFLVSSDLEKLDESLKHTLIAKDSKSIPSVRSKVIKLQEKFPGTQIQDVIEIVCHFFKTSPIELDGSYLSRFEIQTAFNSLTSWEWIWGETPAFEYGHLKIHKGQIKEPFEAKFIAENVIDHLSLDDIKRFFPDFSAQYLKQNEVF